TYRIPGIVVTKRGILLAYAAARRNLDKGDWSDADIVLRRSTDGGRTWEPSRRIAGDGHGTTDNPVAIVDRQTGAIHFLFQKNYARCYYMRSDDDGKSFSAPVDITYVFDRFRSQYDWHVIAPGVGHAIQLRSGRLLVPIWMSLGKPTGPNTRAHRPSAIATIYSDDHGRTWKRGDIILNTSAAIPNPSESMAVQLADGRVMLNIRNESARHRRVVAISPDGISHWSTPRFDDRLFEPICAASIVRYSTHPPGRLNRILFSNPDSEDFPGTRSHTFRERRNLTIRLSNDDGRTWPVKRVLDPGASAYSDLAVSTHKTIYCIYEAGKARDQKSNGAHIVAARFKLGWLLGHRAPK
ncbi:MAG: exo-alpha-sialidase, partial [Acidobacteriota bacterium]|nr:exo-alpha-sialidase [Acidobacteriota bacterium]